MDRGCNDFTTLWPFVLGLTARLELPSASSWSSGSSVYVVDCEFAILADVREGALGVSFRFFEGGSLIFEVEGLLEVEGRRILSSLRRARLRDMAIARSASRVIIRGKGYSEGDRSSKYKQSLAIQAEKFSDAPYGDRPECWPMIIPNVALSSGAASISDVM